MATPVALDLDRMSLSPTLTEYQTNLRCQDDSVPWLVHNSFVHNRFAADHALICTVLWVGLDSWITIPVFLRSFLFLPSHFQNLRNRGLHCILHDGVRWTNSGLEGNITIQLDAFGSIDYDEHQ